MKKETESVLNLDPLISKLGVERYGDPTPVLGILDVFLENAPDMVERIVTAATDRDADALHLGAHSLKTSASYLGAEDMRKTCLELERSGRAENLEGTIDRASELKPMLVRIMEAVKKKRRDLEVTYGERLAERVRNGE